MRALIELRPPVEKWMPAVARHRQVMTPTYEGRPLEVSWWQVSIRRMTWARADLYSATFLGEAWNIAGFCG